LANKKISQLTNSLTKATVATNDLTVVVDTSASESKKMTYGELMSPQDNNFRIAGSSDNTKLVAFEVDGLTTSTTRTLTVPDANLTLVGTDTTQTLTNKTLTSPIINMGSDSIGDTYYRDSGGNTARLPIGGTNQIYSVSSFGIPEWISNPAASDASTTVKGVAEEATQAEVNAGTATGGTGARLFINPSTFSDGVASVINANPSAITTLSRAYDSYTASGNISQYDTVYVTGANTVKTIYPNGQGTPTAISTAASTTSGAVKLFPLSTSGTMLYITGGSKDTSGNLYAQVRTINAAETDTSNGTQLTVYSTGDGTRAYRVAQISTDKFLVIFQAVTGGAAAGIKAVVLSVSGTTVTAGSITTIESTGSLNFINSIAKTTTDAATIFYVKDSDGDLYTQVLTVSGTTITTNPQVLVKVGGSNWKTAAVQLGTGSTMVLYSDGVAANLYGSVITISGTTPSIGAEQTIINTAADYSITLASISSTKVLMVYSETTTPVNDQATILTISGNTITKGSNLALSSARQTPYFGVSVISSAVALVADYSSTTNMVLFLLDISGSTPTTITSQNITSGDTSGIHAEIGLVKIKPWTYIINGSTVANADYIVPLSVSSTLRIGIAAEAISNGNTGNILYRYQAQTLSGLTAASIYYIDETGQPTTNSSLSSPALGISISTTRMFLQ
jgi:hypothetical protein